MMGGDKELIRNNTAGFLIFTGKASAQSVDARYTWSMEYGGE